MARQILPIAGQIAGGMIGGPIGAAIGGALGGMVGSYVDPIRHQGPKLGEARMQTAQEGAYRPLVFGTGCVSGNIIHRSERKVVRHRERTGKGGRDTVDTERGYRTFAIRIAESHTPEGYGLLRIWENETLVYDVRPESEIFAESLEYANNFRFYAGTEDQLPDPDLEAYLGVGNVSAYRGTSYIVFGNYDLTDYGDMIPQFRFEVASNPRVESNILAFRARGFTGDVGFVDSAWGVDWETKLGLNSSTTQHSWLGGSGRIMFYAGAVPHYSDDNGQSWEPSSVDGSFSSSGGLRSPWADNEVSFIPGGISNGSRSIDNGLTYQTVPASNNISTVSSVSNLGGVRWIGLSRGGFKYSDNDCLTWTDGGVVTEFTYPSPSWSDGTTAYFPGGVGAGVPTLYSTVNGVSISSVSLPEGLTGLYVSAVYSNGTILVVATDSGDVCTRRDGSWGAISNFSVRINRIVPYGVGVIAVGSTPPFGKIITSLDGENWVERIVESIAPSHSWGSILTIGDNYQSVAKVLLSDVVGFCHNRVGQNDSDFDAGELGDELDGVVFADGYTARDAITTLLPIYNADASEHDRGSGYRINYIKRGAPVVRTLTIDDLVDEPEETIREDPMERPRVLHLAFESPATGYQAAKASIQRLSPDARLVNEVSTYVPVTFKDQNEAWRRADVQMRIAWTEVNGHRTFSISDAHLDVVPTDVLALSIRGQIQRLRAQEVEYTEGVLKLETVADRQSNYTSNVTGIPLPAPEPPPPSLMGPAALAILDIPAISDQHDRLGYYVAVCGTTEAYAGAVIQRQQNGEWNDVISLSRNQRAIMGVLENTVPAASQHYTDTTNIVSVALYMDDELESLSDSQWLNKGGAFALETAAGWEIMQYRDVEQDSNGVWHLKYLARGRLNTDPDEHLPGARFVLLDDVHFVDADVGMIGEHLTLRAAAVGRSPESADPQTITYQGNSQREFPCAHITAEVDSDGLSMTCVPRGRFGTEQHPVRSINHDGFRWTATDGAAIVTADTDTTSASLDVSGLSLPITATVSQLNRFTGAGQEISEQIE